MKRSLLAIAACAILALSMLLDFSHFLRDQATGFARVAYTFTIEAIRKVFTGPVPMRHLDATAPRALLIAAKTYELHQAERKAPVITSAWRMCPSI